jgi:membrane protease YdiL (CAAX protease family)
MKKLKTKKVITNYKEILGFSFLLYIAIFLQYPIGLAVGRFAFNQDWFHKIGTDQLMLWGGVRIFIILPLIFALMYAIDSDSNSIYLQLGDRNRMIRFAFWGTLAFIIMGALFYPFFLNPTKITIGELSYLLPFFSLYAISNAFVEEVFFRGSLPAVLTAKIPFWLSNVIQAVLFSLIHIINPMSKNILIFVLLTFVLGIFWGYITKITKSLIPAIILHIIADIFVAISLF